MRSLGIKKLAAEMQSCWKGKYSSSIVSGRWESNDTKTSELQRQGRAKVE